MRKTVLLILLFGILSCSEYCFVPEDSHLVIEGYIENDGYPVVMVSRTMPVTSDERNINSLGDYIVRWAKVSIINRNDTVILTGKYDKGFFPPYIYTTSRLKGKVGETYKLLVEYHDKSANATTTITSVPEVDKYIVERCKDNDTLYQIKAIFTTKSNTRNYYQFFSRVGADSKQYLASFLGSFYDEASGDSMEIPVYRGHHILNGNYTPYFSVNDTVAVKCCHLDDFAYNYWKTFIESQYLSGAAMFATTTNMPTNIVGGIGYWFGYGSTTSYFVIKDYAR